MNGPMSSWSPSLLHAPDEMPRRRSALGRFHDEIRRLHRLHASWPLWKFTFDAAAFLVFAFGAGFAWAWGLWPVVLVCWLVAAHFGHTKPLAFHDAAHRTLHPNPLLNEAMGHFASVFIFLPLSVYRYVHAFHHAYLSTERDPEMWPFTHTNTPRWLRVLAAVSEIGLGTLYTPLLFVRGVLVQGNVPRRLKVQMAVEYLGMIAFWAVLGGIVTYFGWWKWFAIGYIVPVMLTGTYQTLRKYVEHMGLTGQTILGLTRTVADERTLGQVLSNSMQNVDHHGAHHRYAKIPFYNLPAATSLIYADGDAELPVFPSYPAAFWDMVKTLGDPKAGSQWRQSQRGFKSPHAAQRHRAPSEAELRQV